jgi:hypothetical protein
LVEKITVCGIGDGIGKFRTTSSSGAEEQRRTDYCLIQLVLAETGFRREKSEQPGQKPAISLN